jgi:hypothetical protein
MPYKPSSSLSFTSSSSVLVSVLGVVSTESSTVSCFALSAAFFVEADFFDLDYDFFAILNAVAVVVSLLALSSTRQGRVVPRSQRGALSENDVDDH